MTCYAPLRGFKGVNGGISWTPAVSFVDIPMEVPCGQCIGCRLERARQWSVRMMHEAQMHEDNVFVTLTYDDEHLPYRSCLVKSDFQKFIKRVRRSLEPRRIGYFHAGEYGGLNGRPHYHAILFGVGFDDATAWGTSPSGHSLFTSPTLSRWWGMGIATFGAVTFESAGYCARYCLKKINGDRADEHYRRVDVETGEIYWLPPEYATMSLKPGLGAGWFEKFSSDVCTYDGVVVDGKLTKPPRYYDTLRGKAEMRPVKRERVFAAYENFANNTDARLKVRETVKLAAISNLKRDL